jgi:hypothetical protein
MNPLVKDAWESGGYTVVATLRAAIEQTKDEGTSLDRVVARKMIEQLDTYLGRLDPTGRLATEYADRCARLDGGQS